MNNMLCTTAILFTHAQVSMNNGISHNERIIVVTVSETVFGLTSDHNDRFSYPARYNVIRLDSENYQFNHFGSKICKCLDR